MAGECSSSEVPLAGSNVNGTQSCGWWKWENNQSRSSGEFSCCVSLLSWEGKSCLVSIWVSVSERSWRNQCPEWGKSPGVAHVGQKKLGAIKSVNAPSGICILMGPVTQSGTVLSPKAIFWEPVFWAERVSVLRGIESKCPEWNQYSEGHQYPQWNQYPEHNQYSEQNQFSQYLECILSWICVLRISILNRVWAESVSWVDSVFWISILTGINIRSRISILSGFWVESVSWVETVSWMESVVWAESVSWNQYSEQNQHSDWSQYLEWILSGISVLSRMSILNEISILSRVSLLSRISILSGISSLSRPYPEWNQYIRVGSILSWSVSVRIVCRMNQCAKQAQSVHSVLGLCLGLWPACEMFRTLPAVRICSLCTVTYVK